MQASAIFQRTESGRNEIKNKMHGLTQSERLALIVIDGVSTYGELRKKLKGLSEERFDRALTKLLQKSFVFEVLLADGEHAAEEFDSKIIDNFLHQDPLDPVTIMSFDPEEEFDLDMPSEGATVVESSNPTGASGMASAAPLAATSAPPAAQSRPANPAAAMTAAVTTHAPQPGKRPLKIASVDFYVPLEPTEKPALVAAPKPVIKPTQPMKTPVFDDGASLEASVLFVTTPKRRVPWGQILVLAGLVIIAISLAFTFIR